MVAGQNGPSGHGDRFCVSTAIVNIPPWPGRPATGGLRTPPSALEESHVEASWSPHADPSGMCATIGPRAVAALATACHRCRDARRGTHEPRPPRWMPHARLTPERTPFSRLRTR